MRFICRASPDALSIYCKEVNIPYHPTGYGAMRTTKPSIFVFSHLCSPQYVTGAEKLLLFMVREMQAVYDCTLIVPGEGLIAAKARAAGVQVIVLPLPLVVSFYLGLPHLFDELREKLRDPAWGMLVRLLEARRPDAILVSTVVHPLPAVAAKAFGIPVLWAVMETIQDTEYAAATAGFISAHADRIIGISASTLRPFQAPEHQAKSFVLPPSWHMEDLAPDDWETNRGSLRRALGIDEGQPLIGYVASSIYENKGFHHFMEMALRLSNRYPAARYVAVGNPVDQPYFDRTLDLARNQGKLGLFRWIRFEERIERLFPAMDALVVPSLAAEGFGMTALEGMIFGKAVVSYASGGLAEIHEATGNMAYAVQPGDIGGLAAQVGSLIERGQLAAVGERNRQAAAQAFGIESYRERLMTLLGQFRPGAGLPVRLVRGGVPTVYLREGGVLRPYASEQAFFDSGNKFEDVQQVPDEWIDALPKGEPIGSAVRASKRAGGGRRRSARSLRKRRLKRRLRLSRRGRRAKRSRGIGRRPARRRTKRRRSR